MSTRSIIGTANDGGFTGRYCHWDGYPSCRARQLIETYHELDQDWEKVRAWAVREAHKGYWSSYMTPSQVAADNALADTVPCPYCGATGIRDDEVGRSLGMVEKRTCNGCSGSGQARNPEKRGAFVGDDDLVDNTIDCGAEWAYLLSEYGITVLVPRHDDGSRAIGWFGSSGCTDWDRVGLIPWDTPLDSEMFEQIEERA